jgi:hypothetical protein
LPEDSVFFVGGRTVRGALVKQVKSIITILQAGQYLHFTSFLARGPRYNMADTPDSPMHDPRQKGSVWYDANLVLQNEARELLEQYSGIQPDHVEKHVQTLVSRVNAARDGKLHKQN